MLTFKLVQWEGEATGRYQRALNGDVSQGYIHNIPHKGIGVRDFYRRFCYVMLAQPVFCVFVFCFRLCFHILICCTATFLKKMPARYSEDETDRSARPGRDAAG